MVVKKNHAALILIASALELVITWNIVAITNSKADASRIEAAFIFDTFKMEKFWFFLCYVHKIFVL